jgi:hypothetical protein
VELSTCEQHVVAFASEQFGEPLTQFLLAGLGEEEVGQRWKFTITYVDGEGTRLRRQVQVISHEPEDGSSCLPRGRDPLVFLALLQLLLRGDQMPNYRLIYEQKDVLRLLGWEDTGETRRRIDDAIKRYFLMTFKWGKSRAELARENLSHYTAMDRPISECRTVDDKENCEVRRVFNRVIFNKYFIEHLKHRRLFDINWNSRRQISLARRGVLNVEHTR